MFTTSDLHSLLKTIYLVLASQHSFIKMLHTQTHPHTGYLHSSEVKHSISVGRILIPVRLLRLKLLCWQEAKYQSEVISSYCLACQRRSPMLTFCHNTFVYHLHFPPHRPEKKHTHTHTRPLEDVCVPAARDVCFSFSELRFLRNHFTSAELTANFMIARWKQGENVSKLEGPRP